VAATDIDFIAAWIDDGCPAEDEHTDIHLLNSQRRARALGHEAHPLATGSINVQRNDNSAPVVRKNINSLSAEELCRYRAAVAKMHSYDQSFLDERSFNWWARIHANNCQHGWEEFLPWHRLYLYYFEQALRDIDPTVTIPYWDWTDNYDQDKTTVTPDSGVIPERFHARNIVELERLAVACDDLAGEALIRHGHPTMRAHVFRINVHWPEL
jgi:tyrosinase